MKKKTHKRTLILANIGGFHFSCALCVHIVYRLNNTWEATRERKILLEAMACISLVYLFIHSLRLCCGTGGIVCRFFSFSLYLIFASHLFQLRSAGIHIGKMAFSRRVLSQSIRLSFDCLHLSSSTLSCCLLFFVYAHMIRTIVDQCEQLHWCIQEAHKSSLLSRPFFSLSPFFRTLFFLFIFVSTRSRLGKVFVLSRISRSSKTHVSICPHRCNVCFHTISD